MSSREVGTSYVVRTTYYHTSQSASLSCWYNCWCQRKDAARPVLRGLPAKPVRRGEISDHIFWSLNNEKLHYGMYCTHYHSVCMETTVRERMKLKWTFSKYIFFFMDNPKRTCWKLFPPTPPCGDHFRTRRVNGRSTINLRVFWTPQTQSRHCRPYRWHG